MPLVAKEGDLFTGSCSECDGNEVIGFLIGDASSVLADSKKVALDGGFGMGECGHMTMIVGGSSTVRAEGKAVAHNGTQVMSSIDGQIIGCSGSVTVGS